MITLYHCVDARSFRPLWALEELELEYELRMLPFPPRVKERSFLAENPLGTIPFMRDGSVHMTESAAMCSYLAARYGQSGRRLDVDPDDPEYGNYLNFLHYGEATLTFPQTLVLRYDRFEPVERRNATVSADYTRWFLARLKLLELHLAERELVCGSRFTVADISVGYALLLAHHLDLYEQLPSRVAAYWLRLRQRSGFARAAAVQLDSAAAQRVPLTPAPRAFPAVQPDTPEDL